MSWTEEELIFAEVFHTALRKVCEGTGSAIAWNAIHLLDKEDWYQFVSGVVSPTEDKPLSKSICVKASRCLAARPATNLVKIGLRLMESHEFDAVAHFVEGCMV